MLRHHDAAPRCGVGIDVVVTDAEAGNDLQPGQAGEERIVDPLDRRGHGHRTHMADRSKECLAVLRRGEVVHGEAREPALDGGL